MPANWSISRSLLPSPSAIIDSAGSPAVIYVSEFSGPPTHQNARGRSFRVQVSSHFTAGSRSHLLPSQPSTFCSAAPLFCPSGMTSTVLHLQTTPLGLEEVFSLATGRQTHPCSPVSVCCGCTSTCKRTEGSALRHESAVPCSTLHGKPQPARLPPASRSPPARRSQPTRPGRALSDHHPAAQSSW